MSKNPQDKAALQCEIAKEKKKRRRILLCIGIVFAITVVGVLIWIDSLPTKLCITQKSSGSAGQYWTCELSTNDVIKEIKYEKNFFGTEQTWIFEQIGVGTITIKWNAYESCTYYEPKSYSITYYFDEDGTYTVLEDTREAK